MLYEFKHTSIQCIPLCSPRGSRRALSLRSFRDAKKQLEISGARKDCKIWLSEDMRAKRVTYAEEHGDKSEEKWYWYGCFYDEMKGEHQPQKYQLVLKGQRPDPSFKFKKKSLSQVCTCSSYRRPFVRS